MNFLGPSLDKIPEGSSLTPADLAKMPNSRFELVFYYSSKLELSATLLLSDFHGFVDIMEARTQRMHEVGLYESSRPREQYR